MNLNNHSVLELMQMYQYSLIEMERRTVIKKHNNIINDYTFWLVSSRMEMELTYTKGYDAQRSNGQKVKIISFRNNVNTKSGLIGIIHDRELIFFDELLVVIYNFDFIVDLALLIPKKIIQETKVFNRNLNGYTLRISNTLTKTPGILDVSKLLSEQKYNEDRIIKNVECNLKIIGKRNFINYYEFFKNNIKLESIVKIMLANNPDWRENTAYTKAKKMKLIFDEKNNNKALKLLINSTKKSISQSIKDRARELLEKNT